MYFRNVFKQMSKKSNLREHFDNQHGTVDQTMLKSARKQLYHIYWSVWRQLIWKKSLLVICKILRMLVNIMTTDDKCFLLNRDNLWQPTHMQLSDKEKTISQFFSQICKCRLNFEHFPKKDDPHSWCISEITHSINVIK